MVALVVVLPASGAKSIALPPSAGFTTLASQPFLPSSLAGKPTVINLWATWCAPCRRELPMMADVAGQVTGVNLVFVNQGERGDAVASYLDKEGLALANAILDPAMAFGRHYEALGLPATLFIGADGMLKSAHLGEISREALLQGIAELGSP